MNEALAQSLLFTLMVGGIATLWYELWRRDSITANRLCICGHPKKNHVKYKDWDSNAWIDGAEYRPGQCRKCKCRNPILQ